MGREELAMFMENIMLIFLTPQKHDFIALKQ